MQNRINNSVLAVAIAAALGISVQAHAETTVYGKIHLSAGRTTSVDTTTGDKITSTQVKSHASRIGFKSDKVLENGMTITGQLEYEVDTVGDSTKTSTQDLIKARNSYLGLKGNFGEVRVGIHDLPSKMSTGSLDPFADTYADYNNVLMADDRGSNLLMYMNKFGGFDFAVAYSASKTNLDTPTATGNNVDAMNSAMLNYTAGPLFVSLSTVNYLNAQVGKTESSPKAGFGYDFGQAKLGLVYEKDMLKDAKDDSAYYGSLQVKVTNTGSINAAYGKLKFGDTTKKDKSFYAIGYNEKLDKSASLYVLYTKGKDDGLATKASLHGDGSAAVVGATYSF